MENTDQRYFNQTHFLSAGEVNAEGELSLPLLTQKMIDIATAHANSLGVGNPSMAALGCGWVLSRLVIEMTAYPKVNQTYRLSTWVEAWNRHFSVRNFKLETGSGETLGYATSVWMVLNTTTHENAGLSHLSLAPEMISGEKVPVAKPGKHILGEESELLREYTFKYCDLDFYRHVNTVRYVELLLNSYPLEQMDRQRVRRLEISFMHEGHYGKPVNIYRTEAGEGSHFHITDKAEGTPIISAEIILTER